MHLLNKEQNLFFKKKFKTHTPHLQHPFNHQHALHHDLHGETFFIYTYTWIGEIHTERAVRVKKNVNGGLIVCV